MDEDSEDLIKLDEELPLMLSDPGTIVLVIFLCCLIVMTIVGNTLVVLAVVTTRRLRTVTNYFIVSLAVSDLLVGLLVMPIAVIDLVTNDWVLGREVCELWVALDVLLCTASILNLCCISLDRYFAITSPLTYVLKRSVTLALIMVAVAWILSALITFPPLIFGWHEMGRSNSSKCTYNSDQGYVIYSALGSFYIPCVLMIYVYWRIFVAAHKRQAVLVQEDKKRSDAAPESSSSGFYDAEIAAAAAANNGNQPGRMQTIVSVSTASHKKGDPDSTTTEEVLSEKSSHPVSRSWSRVSVHQQQSIHQISSSEAGVASKSEPDVVNSGGSHRTRSRTMKRSSPLHRKEGYERAAFQRERRVAKSLAVVVGGFVVCWLPFSITYLLLGLCKGCYIPDVVQASLVWLGWINSTVNPFIYALNNSDFKKAFKRLTIDHFCKARTDRTRHDPRSFT